MSNMEHLLHKVIEKEATIGLIGLGYTGLSLAHDFGNAGFKVIGFDIDGSKIEKLQKKESYLPYLPLGGLIYLLEEKKFVPTKHEDNLAEADVLIIAVPTPLNKERQPDTTSIQRACLMVAGFLKKNRLIILQSTSYPGTTEEVALPLLESGSGLKVGKDFFLAHVPEREDAGNPLAILSKIPRICGGVTRKCMVLAKSLYESITVKVHPCSSVKVAEATKTYENTFRLINIAFVDEMKMVFDKMGINIWEVIEAASTKPFGFTPFYPGPGIGGECIPVDPLYLSWKAKQYNAQTRMIELAARLNDETSEYVVKKIEEASKEMKGSKILVLGVAFKKDVGDIRESPSIRVIKLLQNRNVSVSYHDFYVPRLENLNLESIELTESSLEEADVVVILTDHSLYDWSWICSHSKQIVDTRNATQNIDKRLKGKVIL